jgi:hypothetical protein
MSRDRRKYHRMDTDSVIAFSRVEEREQLAVSKNVSSGGIRFETVGCEIEMGEVLQVTFNLLEHTLVAIGRVVWATEIDPITLDVGIEFIEIDPFAARLLDEATRSGDLGSDAA